MLKVTRAEVGDTTIPGVGVGLGVGVAVGDGLGLGVGVAVGVGLGEGVGLGVGVGLLLGVGDAVGAGVGVGVGLVPGCEVPVPLAAPTLPQAAIAIISVSAIKTNSHCCVHDFPTWRGLDSCDSCLRVPRSSMLLLMAHSVLLRKQF